MMKQENISSSWLLPLHSPLVVQRHGRRWVLLNPMEIHIKCNLQHNSYKWQEGKRTDNVEQFCGNPNAFVVLNNARLAVFPSKYVAARFIDYDDCFLIRTSGWCRWSRGATLESIGTDAGYAVGDSRVHTTSNKRIGACFDDSIAIATVVIRGIPWFNGNRC